MNNNYTQAAAERINESVELAQKSGHSTIEPIHLLASILHTSESINHTLLERSGVSLGALKKSVDTTLSTLAKVSGDSASP